MSKKSKIIYDTPIKLVFSNTVKPVYKGNSREPENVAFISSCPLYTGYNFVCTIH